MQEGGPVEDQADQLEDITPFDAFRTPGKKIRQFEENKIITRSQRKRTKKGDAINSKRKRYE